MTYAADNAIDFASIAQELVGSKRQGSDGSELIPAEAAARYEREGRAFLSVPNSLGATVDQEGLNNNYAVEPEMYFASFPSPEQARQYMVQGAVAALFVATILATAIGVS